MDGQGNALVAGAPSASFQTTPGALQAQSGLAASAIAKITANGSALLYGAHFPGGFISGLVADAAGNAYVTGRQVRFLGDTAAADRNS